MGGADVILQKAKQDYDRGNFRWVAQVVSKVVFADPNNQAARNLKQMRLNNWVIKQNPGHGVISISLVHRNYVTVCKIANAKYCQS